MCWQNGGFMKFDHMQRIPGVLALVVMLAACASTTNVDYRQDFDFTSIKTIRLDPALQPASMDTRVNSPLVEARIRDAIAGHLAARGIAVGDGNADASLVYQVTTRSGVESYGSGVSVGFGTFSRHSAIGVGYGFPGYDVDSYDEMVLTIDILDVPDNAMLWRGSSSERLGNGGTPETMNEMVNRLVNDILSNYPPGNK
jgi:hypothetical protein